MAIGSSIVASSNQKQLTSRLISEAIADAAAAAAAVALDPDAILNSKWQPLQGKEGRLYVADRSALGLVMVDPWFRHIAPKSMRPFRSRPERIDYWSISTVYHGKPVVLRINNDSAA